MQDEVAVRVAVPLKVSAQKVRLSSPVGLVPSRRFDDDQPVTELVCGLVEVDVGSRVIDPLARSEERDPAAIGPGSVSIGAPV